MDNKKPFKHLKNALMMIAANHSSIMLEIVKSKNYRSIQNPFVNPSHSAFVASLSSEPEFDITIGNDFLPSLYLSRQGHNYIIKYNDVTYYFNENNISFHEGRGFSAIHVDITGIESKTDMFTLSTVRDFYDLEYTDIEALKYYINSSSTSYNKLKHV